MSRFRLLVLALAGVLVLSGCWAVPGQGPDRSGYNPFEATLTIDTVESLGQAWSTQVGVSTVDPVISGGLVHVNGGVSIRTGEVVWTSPTGEGQVWTGPVLVDDGRLVTGAQAYRYPGETTAVDAATGDVPVAGLPDVGVPNAIRGDVIVGQRMTDEVWAGTLLLVHLTVAHETDPEVGWSGYINIGWSGDVRFSEDVTLARERVHVTGPGLLATAAGDGTLGNGVRAYPITAPAENCGPADQPRYACPSWATPLPGSTATSAALDADNSTLFVGVDTGSVHALDEATGAIEWSADVGSAVSATPSVAEGVLFVPTAAGELLAFDADGCGEAMCSPLWSATTGAAIDAQPAVAGGVVYTGSSDGSLDAFATAGCGGSLCTAVWSADTGSAITGAPAVSRGRLFVGTADGRLVAYAINA
jgi:outer membrane protein assembly factor BamB